MYKNGIISYKESDIMRKVAVILFGYDTIYLSYHKVNYRKGAVETLLFDKAPYPQKLELTDYNKTLIMQAKSLLRKNGIKDRPIVLFCSPRNAAFGGFDTSEAASFSKLARKELKAKITVDAWNEYSTLQSCLQGDYGYDFSDYEGYLFSSAFTFFFEPYKYPHIYYGKTYPRYHFIQV